MADRNLFIAAYDVRHPRRLRRALSVLKGYSTGGQKSVFECFLTTAERAALLQEVRGVLDLTEDDFLLTPVEQRSKVHVLGVAVPPEDPPFYYLG